VPPLFPLFRGLWRCQHDACVRVVCGSDVTRRQFYELPCRRYCLIKQALKCRTLTPHAAINRLPAAPLLIDFEIYSLTSLCLAAFRIQKTFYVAHARKPNIDLLLLCSHTFICFPHVFCYFFLSFWFLRLGLRIFYRPDLTYHERCW